MNDLLPHLARPAWLLLLPLCGWLLWRLWHRKRRLGRWQALLPPAFQPWLLSGGRGRQNRRPWLLLGLAWLLALLALLGPGWQHLEQPTHQRSDPLVAIVELTPSMLAADLVPNRLEHARRKILDLLAARGEAQTAIVVYAGSAHVLVPLSDDLATAQNLLTALTPGLMPEPGQRADLAVQRALELLDQGANGHGRLLLLSGELSPAEEDGIRAALAERDNPLLLLGVGTPAGAPVPLEDGGFLKDVSGGILLPRLASEQLASFAASLGGGYASLRLDDGDLASLGLLASAGERRAAAERLQPLARWADQGHWLLLPLLLLAACAGRRGWLFAFAALLISPPPAYAFDFADLWWRADQQGQRLLEAGRPAEAAQRFSEPQWRGQAYYQAGDYAAAAAAFAQGRDAAAAYNRGNALAKGGELEAALEAYDQALRRDPQLAAARHNRELVAELLQQRQQAAAEQAASADQQAATESASASGGETAAQSAQRSPGSSETAPHPQAESTSSATTFGSEAARHEQLGQSPSPPQPTTRNADARPLEQGEQRQALEQWLRQIPDDPAELLRRKFWYEQQRRQEAPR
ncbi:VWA domain-containing protein [Pseudomonas sp. MAP12]|uniref:VWA domain-containing protein n=1 Tax=Geopseudomonas aromaticivorans TaxID=2849492 RepID=A0ABS6N0L2_9GAMM|nr:VWA domain-containing protein [Pseudomonas aromaticivorans]MBV2134588.1 VWA domain-containing protein [Pseudomonas aromaticivorans]